MKANGGLAETEVAIRTPRLVLAPLSPHYADALFELLNDWNIVRMLAVVPWPLRHTDVSGFLASDHADTDNFVLVGSSGPIGVGGVKKPGSGDPPRKMPRLGYWIGQRFWGRGYGTEAVGALVDHAFRTFPHDRVGAGIFIDNPASQRVLQKLGFSAMGRKTTASLSRGSEVATIEMQISRAEWTARAASR